MKNLFLILMLVAFFGVTVNAGILPTSRGGTGTSNGTISIPSGGTLLLPAGLTTNQGAPMYFKAGSTLATKENFAFETNGTKLYWTNSLGQRQLISTTFSD